MGFTLGIIVLDETIVGVALPTMQNDLHMSSVTGHWVVNAYLLVLAGFSALAGKLGDILGHRGLFSAGIVVFGLGSLACGFAPDGLTLIGARVIQGLGAATIFPATIALISAVFPPEQRGMALGIQTTFGGVFMTLGPLLGGIFSQDLSWRLIFWINLPIVIIILIVFLATWKEPRNQRQGALRDPAGPALFTVGLLLLCLTVMQGAEWGWTSLPILTSAALGVLSLTLFIHRELTIPSPLYDIRLFSMPQVSAGNLIVFMGQFNKIGVVIFLAAFFQDQLGMSPIEAGLGLLPGMIFLPFTSIWAGRLADRFGNRVLMLSGFAVSLGGILLMGCLPPTASYWAFLPSVLVFGITLPFHYVPTRRGIMNTVTAEQRGEAGGLTMTAQLMGGTFGLAIGSAVYSASHSYQSVFLAMAAISTVVWLISWKLTHRLRE